jgi:hypothetical protein
MFKKDMKQMLPSIRIVDKEGFMDIRSSHPKREKPFWFEGANYNTSKVDGNINPVIGTTIERILDANTIASDMKLQALRNIIRGRIQKMQRLR